MAFANEDDKPWKTDLARKSAERREQVLREVEEIIKKAPSFEEALRQAVEIMKKRFARYSAITAYVADGEDLAVHTSLERPPGPERVRPRGGPLADAAHGPAPTVVSELSGRAAWAEVGLSSGSVMVAPVRTEAGLWAILEVWSDFRDAFTPQDVKLLGRVAHGPRPRRPPPPDPRMAREPPGHRPSAGHALPRRRAAGPARLRGEPRGLRRPRPRRLPGAGLERRGGEPRRRREARPRGRGPGPAPARDCSWRGPASRARGPPSPSRSKAADLGADAALVLTPNYYKARMTAGSAAAATSRPWPRPRPSRCCSTRCRPSPGLPWPSGLAAALAAHPRIAGMKESSGDIGLLGRIVRLGARRLPRGLRLGARALSGALRGRVGGGPGRGLLRARTPWRRSTGPSRPATTRARGACSRRITPLGRRRSPRRTGSPG